jgi:predicted metal-dependent peptidase
MQDPIVDKLITARVGLLLQHPFWGNMSTRLNLVDASEWCPTAATDGRNLFYNRSFVEKLSVNKIKFLIAHELLHCIFDHFGRLGSRDRRLANIAQDYANNIILADEKIGEVITEVNICLDSKYRGMAWEEIYNQLEQQADSKGMDQLLKQLGDLLDEHLDVGYNNDGEHPDRPVLTKEDIESLRDEIKESILQAAQTAGAGKVPQCVQRLIKDLTEPKMDWREVLRMNIQSIVRNDYSFQRYNRKSAHTGAILPGMTNDQTIDVAIAVDTSGSIGDDDVRAFMSEIKGILDQYMDYKVSLWCFDTAIHNHVTITQDNSDEFDYYEIEGGGGTDFMVNWKYMKDMDLQPKKFIMFTDLCPYGEWGDPDYVDTLFIGKGNTSTQAPFGTTVYYENL